jgi:hypothetical protein
VILAVMDDGGEHELAQFADLGEVEEALLPVVPAAPAIHGSSISPTIRQWSSPAQASSKAG